MYESEVYTLSRDGENWLSRFDSLDGALKHARQLAEKKTALLVHDKDGKLISTSFVSAKQ